MVQFSVPGTRDCLTAIRIDGVSAKSGGSTRETEHEKKRPVKLLADLILQCADRLSDALPSECDQLIRHYLRSHAKTVFAAWLDDGPNTLRSNEVRGYRADEYSEWIIAEAFSLDHNCRAGLPKIAWGDHHHHAAALHLILDPRIEGLKPLVGNVGVAMPGKDRHLLTDGFAHPRLAQIRHPVLDRPQAFASQPVSTRLHSFARGLRRRLLVRLGH
jgi:hypothetical protein